MKRHRTGMVYNTTTTAPDRQPRPVRPAPVPAMSAGQVMRLAGMRLLTVGAGIATLAIAGGLAWLYLQRDEVLWLGLACVAALLGLVLCGTLWTYTTLAVRSTWRDELQAGRDLDGDGMVGKPESQPQRARVRLVDFSQNGAQRDPIVLVDDDHGNPAPELDGFGFDAVDVAAFIGEAGRRGLTAGAWLQPGQRRYRLPSGRNVTRGTWDRMTRELRRLGWAGDNGQGLELERSVNDLLRALHDLV